jgi:uncharacterized protein
VLHDNDVIGRFPLDGQLAALKSVLSRNEMLLEVLNRTTTLELPGWYVTAGCLCQTVWNVVTGRPPTSGIKDYDVFYFDDGDLSWDAEDAVIRAGKKVFDDLPTEVEIRNQARVHLWYEQKFGVACAPHVSTESAIDCFPATTCCLGVRLEPGGRWRVYAPHGVSDVFNLVVRPNPVLAPREVYAAKSARWRQQWPELTVLDWPYAPGSAECAAPH